jgi:competence protein ComEA
MNDARIRSKRWVAGLFALTLLALAMTGPPAVALPQTAKPAPSASAPLDINTATAEELQALPGIGTAMASRIVAFREEHGAFRRVEDLMRVKGIGEKSFKKLKPSIKINRVD